MVLGHHGVRNGGGTASIMRYAPDARTLPHPTESTAETQVAKMESKVFLLRAKLPY